MGLHQFLRKQTETSISRKSNTSGENAVVPSESQDGASIPVFSETLAIGSSSSEPDTTLTLSFKHSNSSAFQCYNNQNEHCKSSISQEANHSAPRFEHWSSELYPSYKTNLFKEPELKGPGTGFQHASSSGFKPFRRL